MSAPMMPMQHDQSGVGRWKDADSKEGQGPVKAACLSCRQKKAKCDGVQPSCGQCTRREIQCIYIKSKRGGARKKRVPNPPAPIVEFLKKLDSLVGVPNFGLKHAEPLEGDDPTNVVRTFASNEEILRCYYNEVHPYLPIQPPRHYLVDVLPTLLRPESPFLLAAQTIMTLIPHTLDANPKSQTSKRLRSAASNVLGRKCMAAIDRQLAIAPHIECVQALTLLAVWEWGTTNDAETAIGRYAHAASVARAMGVSTMDKDSPKDSKGNGYALEGIDWRKDQLRRCWWLLYVYQVTAALVSGIPAPIAIHDPNVKVDFPVCSDKDRTWSTWISCISECYRIVALVNSIIFGVNPAQNDTPVNSWAAPGANGEIQEKKRQMLFVDKEISELMKQAERMSIIEHVAGGEDEVAKNQQSACRFALAVTNIHLHRWTAFPEVSFFSKRICGFPKNEFDDLAGDSPSQMSSGSGPAFSQGSVHQSPPGTSPGQPVVVQNGSYSGGSSSTFSGGDVTHMPQQQQQQPQQQPLLLPNGSYQVNGGANGTQYGLPTTQAGAPNVTYTDDMTQMMATFSVDQQQQQTQFNRQQQFNNFGTTVLQPQQQFVPPQQPRQASFSSQPSQQYNSPPAQQFTPQYGAPTPASISQQMGATPQYSTPVSQQQYPTPGSQPYTTPAGQQQFVGQQQQQFIQPNAYPASQASGSGQQQLAAPGQVQQFTASPPVAPYGSVSPQQQPGSFSPPYQSTTVAVNQQGQPVYQNVVGGPNVLEWQQDQQFYQGVIQDMWDPAAFPSFLPQPWFADPNGAMNLFTSGENQLRMTYAPIPPDVIPQHSTPTSTIMTPGFRKHKAWGVDDKGDPDVAAAEEADYAKQAEMFPPGFSLARCATAAHTIVRLEILHRSAAIAADDGIPRWIPFCSCGLVSGAYAFLLLILAVEAQNGYSEESRQQVEDLFTNVKIILAGLEAYGVMWEGIDMMAKEVRSAIDYASNLGSEIRSQKSDTSSPSVPSLGM